MIAEAVLNNEGIVYGAALPMENGILEPKHIRVDSLDKLILLQGSKYVQSEIGDTYSQAKRDLIQGKVVLFSGTPCQIAGLKKYLKKEYNNLITIDIICHGVPSKRLFQDFIEFHGKNLVVKLLSSISEIRPKDREWLRGASMWVKDMDLRKKC